MLADIDGKSHATAARMTVHFQKPVMIRSPCAGGLKERKPMPIVKHRGKKFLLRWKPEWDDVVRKVIKIYKNSNGRVDWQHAKEDDMFKGIPMPFEAIRRRPTWLAYYANKKWLKRDRARSREFQRRYSNGTWKSEKARLGVIREIPNNLVRKKWTAGQIRLLKSLVKKHRTGKLTDWASVLKDPRTLDFPQRQPLILSKFMTSLNGGASNKKYDVPPKKRRQYMRKYRAIVKERRALIREFLYKKLKQRK
jgi:hypothetical protein